MRRVAELESLGRFTRCMLSRTTKRLGLSLLGLVFLCAFALWWLFTIPISASRLRTLTPGMTETEVERMLGRPNQTNRIESEMIWIYSRRPCIAYLAVRFDGTGHYQSYVVD